MSTQAHKSPPSSVVNMIDDQVTVRTAHRLLNLKKHWRCLLSRVAFRQAHLKLKKLSRWSDVAAYTAIQRDSNSSDHVTIKSVKEKLKSWQYSSLDSDDLLADLDKMVAEVATYPKDSVTDVSWMFLTTQRSDYIAVMDHLKPIQDLIVSEHVKTPESLKNELHHLIDTHPLPPGTDMRKGSWFSEGPYGSGQDVVTARENHDKQMRTYAYHNFWARVRVIGWKELEEDLPQESIENESGGSGPSPDSGRQTRGQVPALGYQLEEVDAPPTKKRTAESRDSKRAPKAAKTTRMLDQKDVQAVCTKLKDSQYGSFHDEEIQKLKSRLAVCHNDRARHEFSIMVRNEDGSDGVYHRSVKSLVRQLQAEATAKNGRGKVATTPPRQEGSASGQALALLSTTSLPVTPPTAGAAAAAVPHMSVPVTTVRATPTESPVQTATMLAGVATARVVPTTPGPAMAGLTASDPAVTVPTAPTPAGPTAVGMPTATASGVVQKKLVTKEQAQHAEMLLKLYKEQQEERQEMQQKLAVAQKEMKDLHKISCLAASNSLSTDLTIGDIVEKLGEVKAAVAKLQAACTCP